MIENNKLDQFDCINPSYSYSQENKYSSWIGLFFMRFSYLENELDILLSELINNRGHDLGYIIIGNMNLRQKIVIIEKILKFNSTIVNCKHTFYNSTFKKIREVSEFRNKLAHANWSTLKKGGIVRYKFDLGNQGEGVIFKSTKIYPRDIKKNINTFDNIIENIHQIKDKFGIG